MLYADGLGGLIFLGLWLFCLIDVITTDESRMRNLPKPVWVLIVLLIPFVGSLVWLVAGRVWDGTPRQKPNTRFAEYDRPGRHVAQNPDDDDEFLAGVRARAEAQRRQYDARRKRELAAEQEALRERPEPEDPR